MLTVRLDPFPPPATDAAPLPTVRAFVNDHLTARVELRWNPDRVGAYEMRLPAAAVKAGG